MYLNYLYCHSFASLEERFEKGVILSNPFSIDSGRISDIDKTEILRASHEALRMTSTVKLFSDRTLTYNFFARNEECEKWRRRGDANVYCS
jgi:hypothetical protein